VGPTQPAPAQPPGPAGPIQPATGRGRRGRPGHRRRPSMPGTTPPCRAPYNPSPAPRGFAQAAAPGRHLCHTEPRQARRRRCRARRCRPRFAAFVDLRAEPAPPGAPGNRVASPQPLTITSSTPERRRPLRTEPAAMAGRRRPSAAPTRPR
jgi:hypothetical protein